MKKNFLLKDILFNEKKIVFLADILKKSCKKNNHFFEEKKFIKKNLEKFPELELKERISHIAFCMKNFLPEEYEKSLKIILDSLPAPLDEEKKDGDFGDFIFSAFGQYIVENGKEKKYLKKNLYTISQITKRFTMELYIRSFINNFPEETFLFLEKMSLSKNYHQKRLASEGLRPKLPWAFGINIDYKKSEKILDNLYFDSTRYVVRSVANHLNDISKIDLDFVLKILKKWEKEKKQTKKEMEYLKNHALRTSVKKGEKKSLNFLGFETPPKVELKNFSIKKNKIILGNFLEFSFEIFSEKKQNLMIDYKIIYPKKNNKKSQKVFKIKSKNFQKNENLEIFKKHLFKEMTTKKLYDGKYFLEIQINGSVFFKNFFYLEIKKNNKK